MSKSNRNNPNELFIFGAMQKRSILTICSTLLCILIQINLTIAQEVQQYQSVFPEKKYNQTLELEKEALLEIEHSKSQGLQYLKLCKSVLEYSEPLCAYYCNRALEIGTKANLDSIIGEANTFLAFPYINTGKYDTAEPYIKKGVAYWLEQKDSMKMSEAYIIYAYLRRKQGSSYEALEYLNEAKKIQLQYLPIYKLGNIYNRIIINYNTLKDYESAAAIGTEFINTVDTSIFNPGWQYTISLNTSTAYLKLKDYEAAEAMLNVGLARWKNSKAPKRRAIIYAMLGNLTLAKKEYALASAQADTALYYALQFDNPGEISDAYGTKYEALIQLGKKEEAFENLKLMKKYALASNDKRDIMGVYQSFSEHLASNRQYAKAYHDLVIADSLRNELYLDDMIDNVKNLEKKIIREESDKKIALLNEQNQLKEENLGKEKRLRYFLLGLLIFAAFSSLLLYLLFRQRNKNNTILQEKNKTITKALEENKFLVKEVHHRVKNNLQVIASLLNLQARYVNDPSAITAIKDSRLRVLSMSLLHKNVYSNENLKDVDIQGYFQDLLNSLNNAYDLKARQIHFETDIEQLELNIDKVVPLGLIANEIITNAFKHAFTNQEQGIISLKVKKQDGFLYLIIHDNGKGVPFDVLPEKSKSMGSMLIKSFVKKLKGSVEIKREGGSTFVVKVPLGD